MRAGRLKHRITIEKPELTKDEFGQPTKTWVVVCTTRAAIDPISGKEFFAAQQINNAINYKITMRYRPGIKPQCRVKYKDRLFDIHAVLNPKEANRELQLMCEEHGT
ncbi:phage head closure protein [Spartinivicinus ruber]|uniref:phage head closure protein n=1 Tax=Spartinivicinus ruber TaxID=2683272 RepID=UPI0013D8038D|nr:phage head closure protein [Spartinivicinus ruber]